MEFITAELSLPPFMLFAKQCFITQMKNLRPFYISSKTYWFSLPSFSPHISFLPISAASFVSSRCQPKTVYDFLCSLCCQYFNKHLFLSHSQMCSPRRLHPYNTVVNSKKPAAAKSLQWLFQSSRSNLYFPKYSLIDVFLVFWKA